MTMCDQHLTEIYSALLLQINKEHIDLCLVVWFGWIKYLRCKTLETLLKYDQNNLPTLIITHNVRTFSNWRR